jgi:hypothetical protein
MSTTTIKVPAPRRRSGLFVALIKRHTRITTMKDRRTPRGGARNKQRDYREENY